VQHVAKASGDGADPDLEKDDDITRNDGHVPADLLGKVWSLVKAIRASGQHQASFNQVVSSGNDAGWWKGEDDAPVTIQPRLLHDVQTRWGSAYHMRVRSECSSR
jgi:hypothetical protein